MNRLLHSDIVRNSELPLFQRFLRLAQWNYPLPIKIGFKAIYRWLRLKRGIEIPSCTKIGEGLYLGHAYNITINGSAVIGRNVNIHKGVTIGKESRGKRIGSPTIGNSVWIGVNACVVGKIVIGDDVMIAPNAYVNFDVPSHSIVIGNPGTIIHRDNATDGYICNKFEE